MSEETKTIYEELEKIIERIFFNSFVKPTPHQLLQMGMWYKDSLSRIRVNRRLMISISNAMKLLEELENIGYLERDKDDQSRYLVTEKYQHAFFKVYVEVHNSNKEKYGCETFLNTLEHVENDCNEISTETHEGTCTTEINPLKNDSE